ncbi:MAG: hypothetical protein NWT08_02590 [Akkermansiaceae bacterium]|jgi:hypothetical protein|nr:hypothetical protein [Akkermansiaceae bacterium]MDP4646292.1 hypothetical protein [Akkermansiaceae bacterium]MDP4721474.1 hypothetical protein [Akkermansiaceae bacterium]MDP4779867.1 hypothetical protein [Akkermansiaceae bacterium]MDP4845834.1 hypothetical protein [Akkermansiaceae bacterium]
MKTHTAIAVAGAFIATASTVSANSIFEALVPDKPANGAFEDVVRPMTNTTLFDLALPTTNVRPIFIHHNLPDRVSVGPGGAATLPMGGDVQIYALQFEIALSERLSIVATKDGYVDINPGDTSIWSAQSGFANIGAGLKYAFIYDPANEFVLSGSATFELPTGNDDVFQGQGDGVLNLIVSGLKIWDDFQLASGAGLRLAMDDTQSTSSFVSGHASYKVHDWFIPLVELNWHHVLEPGNGTAAFNSQAGGAVPGAAAFEGSDLLNFGAQHAGSNRDLVTAAVGFRSQLTDSMEVGAAYEIPLTNEQDGIIEDRFTLDLIYRF